ncbi:MAG: electron transport complex subunit RsxC [Vicinamibacteria bacterium]|nr:electron transport complex subunit RsxC [Vicinamibacteria bacterium]
MAETAVIAGFQGTFPHGIHPDDRKSLAANTPIEVLPAPKTVLLPVLQHLGAPSNALTRPNQEVVIGEQVASAVGFISAGVHASVNGIARRPVHVTLPNGRRVPAIPITAGAEQHSAEQIHADFIGGEWPTVDMPAFAAQEIVDAVLGGGIVGLGGAAFPTHVKLTRQPNKTIDAVLVNGCECEPYLTSDYRLMIEAPRAIVAGGLLAAKAVDARFVVIAVEDNKPKAIAALREACAGTNVVVKALRTKYPMGGEKQTVRAVLGRTVPTLGLPLDVGVVVVNVGTAHAVARIVLRGKPLTHRVISVTGHGVKTPRNLIVPIGSSYRSLLDFCGGLRPEAARVLSGGPMMGFTVADHDTPVTKGTSGVTVLTRRDVSHSAETACLRCGRCAHVCPLNLVPTRIAMAARKGNWDVARRYHIQACMECGCCTYACPASIPLVQLIRVGKARLPQQGSGSGKQ